MRTDDCRFTLTYNGEIYNAHVLRQRLLSAGETFRGTSDTEVLLLALARFGVPETLRELNGMFAFALWDEVMGRLWLARDRFGEKPLYYGWHEGVFLFGSELKALAAHPAFRREIDPAVVSLFVRFACIPSPHCIFRGTFKLPPGNFLMVAPGGAATESAPYWRLQEIAGGGQFAADDPMLLDTLDAMLRRAVGSRMMADVPIGAFLSGGIDSSTIVALMQAQSARPVKTFTIGFKEANYNEAIDAARIAAHLKTEHHELYLSSRDCLEMLPRLPEIYDEPFADSSQIPTTLVSRFTVQHVTVALSGDAGDEMFGGYHRHVWTSRLWPKLQGMPRFGRQAFAELAQSLAPSTWDRLFAGTNRVLPSSWRLRGGGEKIHKLARAMEAETLDELYLSLVSQWKEPSRVVRNGGNISPLGDALQAVPPVLGSAERMMFLDTITYLPSDILCKVDRASMSTGLEARVPFLDNDLAEFVWKLPINLRIRDGVGKWPLRQVLKRYVPEELFERPKAGFGVPIGDWLRGPLRDWGEHLLSEPRLREGGFFEPRSVRIEWERHQSGRRNSQHALWPILMFEAWRERWL